MIAKKNLIRFRKQKSLAGCQAFLCFFAVNFIEFCLFFVTDLAIFRCFFAAKTAVFILREQLRDYQNAKHQRAKRNSVPTEYGEAVLLHKAHQQLDAQH